MLNVTMVAKVWYNCVLDDEDEMLVKQFAEDNDMRLEDAVWQLYTEGKINNLYGNSSESDFSTIDCLEVEEVSENV